MSEPARANADPRIGQTVVGLGGEYQIIEAMQTGGQAEIFLARDAQGRDVVLKFPRRDDETSRRRFQRECEIARKVQPTSVHLMHALDVSSSDGVPFLVLPKFDGTLATHASRKLLSWGECRPILLQMLSALNDLHALGYIHRDVTPNNIFLGSEGAVLGDYGIAFACTGTVLTNDNALPPGTRGYVPPWASKNDPNRTHDFYALGRTVLNVVLGKHRLDEQHPDFVEQLRRKYEQCHGHELTIPDATIIRLLMSNDETLQTTAFQQMLSPDYQGPLPAFEPYKDLTVPTSTDAISDGTSRSKVEPVSWYARHQTAILATALLSVVVMVGGAIAGYNAYFKPSGTPVVAVLPRTIDPFQLPHGWTLTLVPGQETEFNDHSRKITGRLASATLEHPDYGTLVATRPAIQLSADEDHRFTGDIDGKFVFTDLPDTIKLDSPQMTIAMTMAIQCDGQKGAVLLDEITMQMPRADCIRYFEKSISSVPVPDIKTKLGFFDAELSQLSLNTKNPDLKFEGNTATISRLDVEVVGQLRIANAKTTNPVRVVGHISGSFVVDFVGDRNATQQPMRISLQLDTVKITEFLIDGKPSALVGKDVLERLVLGQYKDKPITHDVQPFADVPPALIGLVQHSQIRSFRFARQKTDTADDVVITGGFRK